MPRILLIDDDAQLGPPLAAYLQRFDMTRECALRPSTGLALLRRSGRQDGFELCRTLRRESDIPIIMLTARGEVMDRMVGLELRNRFIQSIFGRYLSDEIVSNLLAQAARA